SPEKPTLCRTATVHVSPIEPSVSAKARRLRGSDLSREIIPGACRRCRTFIQDRGSFAADLHPTGYAIECVQSAGKRSEYYLRCFSRLCRRTAWTSRFTKAP